MGMLGMRERATLLGGSLSVESARGRGVTIRVIFPQAALSQGEVGLLVGDAGVVELG